MLAGCALVATLAALGAPGGATAQTAVRSLTTLAALRQFPGYFHLQNVLVHGEFAVDRARVSLRAGDREIGVLLNDAKALSGLVEVWGQLLDVGRLEPGDPRLTGDDGARTAERWPRPGEELILSITGVTEAQPLASPSLRALALQPWRFDGRPVTVVGQFRGRNLYGDLPSAPGTSPYDFVLRSTDAALWVTGLRPRGRDFDLDVDARVDTGRWLQVTGMASQVRGLVTIAATAIAATTAPDVAQPARAPAVPSVPPEPAEVIFSSPIEGESDVARTSSVRIQFSRDLDPATLTDRIRVLYVGGAPAIDPQAAALEFTHAYDVGTRAVAITFTHPLDPFRTLSVELLDGIRTFDGAPLRPWTLAFSVGG